MNILRTFWGWFVIKHPINKNSISLTSEIVCSYMRVFTAVQSFRKNKKIHILLKTFAIWLAQVVRSKDKISYYTVIQMETQGSRDNMQNDVLSRCKNVSFITCHLGKLLLICISPKIISPRMLMSRIDYNFSIIWIALKKMALAHRAS